MNKNDQKKKIYIYVTGQGSVANGYWVTTFAMQFV